jgi:hypothetical protein
MTDRDLEGLLLTAASSVRYPPSPDLSDRVLAKIVAADGRRTRKASRSLRAIPAMPAVSLMLVGLLVTVLLSLAISPAGEAIARFFGVEGSKVERLPEGATTTPPSGDAGLGPTARLVSLTEAAAMAGFAPGLPSGEGEPQEVHLVHYGSQTVIVLRYERFDLWQAQLQQNAYFAKQVPQQGTVREVSVRNVAATWLAGAPHFVSYVQPGGPELRQSIRTVNKNTLIWRTARAFYRLETDLPLEDALRIAEMLP